MFLRLVALLFVVVEVVAGCGTPLPQDPFDPLGPWHQRHLDCGIPPFAYRLPQSAQSKIHAIWIKYEAGDDCEEEQNATRQVIMSLSEDERHATFKGMCGPGFLRNESATIRDAFHKVWFDESLDVDQKQAEFQKIAAQHLTGNSKSKFDKFIQTLEEHKKERKNTIEVMSPAAQEAYNQWVGMRKEERNFLSGLSAEIRAELGLICKCCGGCKTGKPAAAAAAASPPTRATRSIGDELNALVGAIQRADAHILHLASASECN